MALSHPRPKPWAWEPGGGHCEPLSGCLPLPCTLSSAGLEPKTPSIPRAGSRDCGWHLGSSDPEPNRGHPPASDKTQDDGADEMMFFDLKDVKSQAYLQSERVNSLLREGMKVLKGKDDWLD